MEIERKCIIFVAFLINNIYSLTLLLTGMDPLKSKITMKEKTKKTKRMQQMSAKGGAALMVTRLNVYKNGNVSLARINVDRLAEMLRTGGRYVEQVEALRHDLAHHRGRGIDFTFDKTVERIIPQSLVAQRGGKVAGTARQALEAETGQPVVTEQNASQLGLLMSDLIEAVAHELPKKEEDT